MARFSSQIGLVTGASSGIGRAIAVSLAGEGARVCLVGRNPGMLAAVADTIHSTSPRPLCYRADLTRDEDIQELAADVERHCGHIDILVHSAAAVALGDLQEASIEDLDWQYRTNVRAPYALTQALLPMLTQRRGQIVFINSSAGLKASARAGQYAATKHALKAIAESLRAEVNGDELRVLNVFLGRTATPMQELVHRFEGKHYEPKQLLQPEDVAAVVVNALGLSRTAEVTDILIRPMKKFD